MNSLGAMLSTNPAAARLFGYAPDELIGHNITMLLPPPSHADPEFSLARYLAAGKNIVLMPIWR